MSNRIISIDFLRGIAVLQMVFFQIFDFFAKTNIYSDSPYYFTSLGMVIEDVVSHSSLSWYEAIHTLKEDKMIMLTVDNQRTMYFQQR